MGQSGEAVSEPPRVCSTAPVLGQTGGLGQSGPGQGKSPSREGGGAASLGGAGRAVHAAAQGRAHGFGRNQVQVLVVGNLIQAVAVLEQLPA